MNIIKWFKRQWKGLDGSLRIRKRTQQGIGALHIRSAKKQCCGELRIRNSENSLGLDGYPLPEQPYKPIPGAPALDDKPYTCDGTYCK